MCVRVCRSFVSVHSNHSFDQAEFTMRIELESFSKPDPEFASWSEGDFDRLNGEFMTELMNYIFKGACTSTWGASTACAMETF